MVVVVVVGLAGRTMVWSCSVVVEVVEVCGCSEAQPARETSANAARQEKVRFFSMEVLLRLVLPARTFEACAPVKCQVGYGVVVVVLVVFLTMTLVATILVPS